MTLPHLCRSAPPALTPQDQPPQAESWTRPRLVFFGLGFVLCHSIEIAIP